MTPRETGEQKMTDGRLPVQSGRGVTPGVQTLSNLNDPGLAEFSDTFDVEISERLTAFEESRATAMRTYRRRRWQAGTALLVSSGAALLFAPWFLLAIGLAALPAVRWCRNPILSFRARRTDAVLPAISEYLGEGLNYKTECPKPISLFQHLGILPTFDEGESHHYLAGEAHGTAFHFFAYELLQRAKMAGKNAPPVLTGEGVFLICEIDRLCYRRTIIYGGETARDEPAFQAVIQELELEPYELPDTTGSFPFSAFTEEPDEASVLLTAETLMALHSFAKQFGASAVRACFYRGRLYVSVPSHSLPAITAFDDSDVANGAPAMLRGILRIPDLIRVLQNIET